MYGCDYRAIYLLEYYKLLNTHTCVCVCIDVYMISSDAELQRHVHAGPIDAYCILDYVGLVDEMEKKAFRFRSCGRQSEERGKAISFGFE